MKKLSLYIISFILLSSAFVSEAKAEVITDFSSTYTINRDGTVLVKEVIVYDFEDEERRGIFRTLDTNHPQPATKRFSNRSVEIEVIEVLQDGKPAEFVTSSTGDEIEIKIGNPDVYIKNVHEYQISYLLKGALSYGTDGAELYWNATGNGWPVTINRAQATIVSDKIGILGEKSACYKGAFQSSTACDEKNTATSTTIFLATFLAPYEGLTIAQEVNASLVEVLIVETPNIMWMLWVLGGVWITGLTVWAWRFHRKNEINKPVIAQYEPYEKFLPMYTGLLLDYRLDSHDITAGIIYLAEQGFLTIKKTDKKVLVVFTSSDYEVTLTRPIAEIPTTFLKEVATLLFAVDAPIQSTVLLSSLLKKQTENSKIVLALQAALKKDLEAEGFLETQYKKTAGPIFIAFVMYFALAFLVFAMLGALNASGFVLLILAVVGTVVIYVSANYNRRSKKGFEALNHLQGFKLFLSVTEKERYTFFNAPEKSPELFMQYLPYAIALKVEKEWAKVFEGITIPNPNWYDGGNMGAFSAAAFTSDMSAFATNFSSTSGTSASSGGGSSGGGGGGGGGGSW